MERPNSLDGNERFKQLHLNAATIIAFEALRACSGKAKEGDSHTDGSLACIATKPLNLEIES